MCECRETLKLIVGVIVKFAAESFCYNGLLNLKETLIGLANVMNIKNYPIGMRTKVLGTISDISRMKGNDEAMSILLQSADKKFLDNFSRMLLDNLVNCCENIGSDARDCSAIMRITDEGSKGAE